MKSRLNPAIRQGLLYASSIVLMKSTSLITLPVVAAHLTPENYGELELLVTLADVGGILLGLGLVEALFRFGGAAATLADKQTVVANAFGLTLAVCAAAFAATQLAAPTIAAALPTEAIRVLDVRWLLTTLVITTVAQIPLAWMRMSSCAGSLFLAVAAKSTLQVIFVVAALRQGYGVTGILAANAIAEALLLIALGIWQWRETGIALTSATAQKFITYSWPLLFSGLALFVLGSFDRWLLADAVGPREIAFYALAGKFALIAALMIKPFEMWWFPRRFEMLQQPRGTERSARIVTAAVTYIVVVTAGTALLGPALLYAMLPTEYHPAATYLPWVAVATAIQCAANVLTVGCYIGRTTLIPMTINIAAAALALCGYVVLIPTLGVTGAIVATIAAHLVRLCLFHCLSQRAIFLPYPLFRLLAFSGTALAIITWATAASPSAPLVTGTAALGTLLIAAFVFRLWPYPSQFLPAYAVRNEPSKGRRV